MAKKYIDQKVELDVSCTFYPVMYYIFLASVSCFEFVIKLPLFAFLEWDKNRRLFGDP